MAKLIFAAITSLDGYVADANGEWDWSMPDEEVHAFVNDLERPINTYLYGRRMYEVMAVWENPEAFAGDSPEMLDYAAVWQAADKVVYSTTLEDVSSARTSLRREFDVDEVRELKDAATHDISIAGPGIAAHALRAGLVDDIHLIVSPAIVGGGNPRTSGRLAARP